MAAAWLHDVIEDTPMNFRDVEMTTNRDVAEIVLALTDEIGRNRKERKTKSLPKLKGRLDAQTVKLADWIANVEDAVERNPKMLQMYQKDYPDFAASCRHEFGILEPMWTRLEALLA